MNVNAISPQSLLQMRQMNASIKGEGLLVRDEGTLPPNVRKMLESVKDEKITSVQAWRYPLMKSLQNIIKKIVTLPYDSIFHLGLNLSGKYNLEKDVLVKFTKGGHRGDSDENKSEIYDVKKDITYGQLFDELRKKMGKNFTTYNARTNNCQDFSLAILSVLGVNDEALKKFIKQDADKIFKSAGLLEPLVEAASSISTLKDQIVDRQQQGEGRKYKKYNFGYPESKIFV